MIKMFKAKNDNIDDLIKLRLEMLREVNSLPDEYVFPEDFVMQSKIFFTNGDQTTWLIDDDGIISCATICYYELMPTYDHPSGKRAQIMNVYTRPGYRKQGYASTLLKLLIDEAKNKGVTEIKLDSAVDAHKFYKLTGFSDSNECMVLDINKLLKRNIELAEKTGCKMHKCDCTNNA